MSLQACLEGVRTEGGYYLFVWGGLPGDHDSKRISAFNSGKTKAIEVPRGQRGQTWQYYAAAWNLRSLPQNDEDKQHVLTKGVGKGESDLRLNTYMENYVSANRSNSTPCEEVVLLGDLYHYEKVQVTYQKKEKIPRSLSFIDRMMKLAGREVLEYDIVEREAHYTAQREAERVTIDEMVHTKSSTPASFLYLRPNNLVVDASGRLSGGVYVVVAAPEQLAQDIFKHLEQHPQDYTPFLSGLFPTEDYPLVHRLFVQKVLPAGRLRIADLRVTDWDNNKLRQDEHLRT